jgi:NDP-sugar pyrophosphorylase family protein
MNAGNGNLRCGILAAGRGERLRRGTSELKPLVKVAGEALIERVLRSMANSGASEVAIIINEDSGIVREHVGSSAWPFELRWIVETTPTSMHSFLRLIEVLSADGNAGPFLLSTVDTVAGAETFARFFAEARMVKEADVVLALTSPGDDEKPLLVRLAAENTRVVAIGAEAAGSESATAGIYAVRARVLREAGNARRDGIGSLRAFLGRLLERGYRLEGLPVPGSVDVDHPADIETAEAFLRSARR